MDILRIIVRYIGYAVLLFLALFVLYVIVLGISSLLVDKKKDYKKNSKYHRTLLYMGTWLALGIMGIKLVIRGMDKVPKDTRFLVVANHKSKFDPIVSWWILRKFDVAYVSKPSNFNVPFYGPIIRPCCFLSIDREDPRQSMKVLMKAADLIKSDAVSIGIYPEGTRNYGDGLLPFHNGIFKVAQMAKVPVVVMTTKNTEMVHKNFPFKRTTIYVDFLETISVEEIAKMKTAEIGDHVRNLMLENLQNAQESVKYEEEDTEKKTVCA